MSHSSSLFDRFVADLESENLIKELRNGIIGHNTMIAGSNGPNKLIYADYVASGRSLQQIEEFVQHSLLPFYANSHTQASFVGGTMTHSRREARNIIRGMVNATADHSVIFTGSGATLGINRLVHLFGISKAVADGKKPLVIIGPYEHHSNILPWRESGAEIFELPEAPDGGPCMAALDIVLKENNQRPIFAAFSAASNVTGILTDVTAVTRRLKKAGAKIVWDYAGGGPYLTVDMCPSDDALIDAIVMSPHKFMGGPQASGLLIVRNDATCASKPTYPGGGTVRFVSPTMHDYSSNIEAREEAGTPNVIGDLRAALCFLVKDAVGQKFISDRNQANCDKAFAAWSAEPNIEILGRTDCPRLPIFSFRVRDGSGGYVHQQLVTRMLSDRYGIQARGGCACAGPYVHRLLCIDDTASEQMRQEILSGNEIEKPGFVRLNLSYLASDEEIDFIIASVKELAQDASAATCQYECDTRTAIFSPV